VFVCLFAPFDAHSGTPSRACLVVAPPGPAHCHWAAGPGRRAILLSSAALGCEDPLRAMASLVGLCTRPGMFNENLEET